jgi:hypothetical protein
VDIVASRVVCRRTSTALSTVLSVALLGGCAAGPVAVATPPVAGKPAAAGATADRPPPSSAHAAPLRLAALALPDRELGRVRGGFDLSGGLIVSFGFRQATYVNDTLVQSIVIPTLTIGNGTVTVPGPVVTTTTVGAQQTVSTAPGVRPGSVSLDSLAARATPAVALNGLLASVSGDGLTSVTTELGTGSLTNVIKNAANNTAIRTVANASIGISGLSRMLDQNGAAMALNRLAQVNAMRH